jgi:hypothetical protein
MTLEVEVRTMPGTWASRRVVSSYMSSTDRTTAPA